MIMGRTSSHRMLGFTVCLVLLGLTAAVFGQDLEPRAYSAAPVGTRFLVLGTAYSFGDVLLDPSVPITDVAADIGMVAPGYATTLDFAGRTASLAVILPYAFGKMSGMIGEDFQEITRSGIGDLRVRLAVNLLGGRALTPQEFVRRKPRPSLGASVVVLAPSGQYFPEKLVNIGTNRWAFKPELGFSFPTGRWILDLAASVWLFTHNPNFYGGQLRTQDPLWAGQAHVSYTFRPGLWLAADATLYAGGQTSLDGVVKDDRQENSRGGLTLSLPMGKAYSLKFSGSTGVITRIGGKFTTFSLAFQYRWFGR
jgi:hypothetical protein